MASTYIIVPNNWAKRWNRFKKKAIEIEVLDTTLGIKVVPYSIIDDFPELLNTTELQKIETVDLEDTDLMIGVNILPLPQHLITPRKTRSRKN